MVLAAIKGTVFGSLWLFGVFMISGLVTNLLEIMLLIFLWPLSKQVYRIVLANILYAFFCVITFSVSWWSDIKVLVYADEESLQRIGKEKAILISNHRGVMDWLSAWLLAENKNILSGCKCFVKDKVKYAPTMGWTWWFAEFAFLKRNWDQDKKQIIEALKAFREYPIPCWLGIFPEGTRLTPAKLKASQEYAKGKGIEPTRHCLLPRPRGFVTAVEALAGYVPAVYDLTVMAENEDESTFMSVMKGKSSTVHLHLRRYDMETVSGGVYEETAEWCKERFRDKDVLINYFYKHQTFPGKPIVLQKSKKSLALFLFWSVLLGATLIYGGYFLVSSGSVSLYCAGIIVCFLGYLIKRQMFELADRNKGSSYGLSGNTKHGLAGQTEPAK